MQHVFRVPDEPTFGELNSRQLCVTLPLSSTLTAEMWLFWFSNLTFTLNHFKRLVVKMLHTKTCLLVLSMVGMTTQSYTIWGLLVSPFHKLGYPGGASGKEPTHQCRRCKRHGFLWRREWQSTPVFLPGKFHRQRSLVGYSPWDRKESDTSELTNTFP